MVTIIVKLEQNGSCQAKCGLRDDLAAHMSEYLSFKELVNMAPLWEGPVVKLEKNTGLHLWDAGRRPNPSGRWCLHAGSGARSTAASQGSSECPMGTLTTCAEHSSQHGVD